jgi:uncharacterized membrane protein YcaP (DUF421 family)
MWTPSLPAWEFVLRGTIVYFAIMVLIRISGKRTVGEFTPFDLIVVLLIGEATQGALTAGDETVTGALIVCATMVGLNFLIAFASTRSKLVDRLIEGEPVVLIRNGRVFRQAMRRNHLPENDLDEALRRHGVANRSDVALAMLETDGDISVVKRDHAGDE